MHFYAPDDAYSMCCCQNVKEDIEKPRTNKDVAKCIFFFFCLSFSNKQCIEVHHQVDELKMKKKRELFHSHFTYIRYAFQWLH